MQSKNRSRLRNDDESEHHRSEKGKPRQNGSSLTEKRGAGPAAGGILVEELPVKRGNDAGTGFKRREADP